MKNDPPKTQRCTCPSGDGSLRWPCPTHPAEAQPVAWQFQDREGKWHGFMDERHRQNTIADGSWPVRALYAAPPSAPVGVEWPLSLLRAGNWREVYVGHRCMRLEVTYEHATWERLMEQVEAALAQQPPAESQAVYAGVDLEGGWIRAPEAQPVGSFSAGDMADAAAQGFRDGVASVGVVGVGREYCPCMEASCPKCYAQQPAAVDGAYPAPRNRREAAALARLALAYLGATGAHIEAAVARCETDLAAQQGGSNNDR